MTHPGGASPSPTGLTLGIESSCDESSIALLRGREVLVNLIASQEALHAGYGGVVPEMAARAHLEQLPRLLDAALERTGTRPEDVDLLAVTRGPGLVGCLLVGAGLAAGLAAAWDKPLVGVNHLWGHVYAALLAQPDLEPPLLAMVVSGAHSDLVWMPRHGEFEVMGRTRDDAAGEAFDKAARMLGLGYPGGPALDRLARSGEASRQPLPVPALPGLEYSFSGLKTALLYRLRDLGEPKGGRGGGPPHSSGVPAKSVDFVGPQQRADLAAAFERSVVESLLAKLDLAIAQRAPREVVIAGGVAANTLLRRRAAEVIGDRARLTIPPLKLCTDNAAMIAAAAALSSSLQPATAEPSLGW